MTAIRPADSALRDKIDSDKYNNVLNTNFSTIINF